MKRVWLQIVLLILIFIVFLCVCAVKINTGSEISNEEKAYREALKYITNQSGVKHFPAKIPEDARNIKVYKDAGYFGSEKIYLKFITNKQYIQNELSKYDFVEVENPEERNRNLEFLSLSPGNISLYTYNLYIIKKGCNDRMRCFSYGIAVNNEINEILYYYSSPD